MVLYVTLPISTKYWYTHLLRMPSRWRILYGTHYVVILTFKTQIQKGEAKSSIKEVSPRDGPWQLRAAILNPSPPFYWHRVRPSVSGRVLEAMAESTWTVGMAVMMSSIGASSSATVSCSLRVSAVPAWLSGP